MYLNKKTCTSIFTTDFFSAANLHAVLILSEPFQVGRHKNGVLKKRKSGKEQWPVNSPLSSFATCENIKVPDT